MAGPAGLARSAEEDGAERPGLGAGWRRRAPLTSARPGWRLPEDSATDETAVKHQTDLTTACHNENAKKYVKILDWENHS